MKNPEEIDPDWARYAETILVFSGKEPFDLDLREPVTDAVRLFLKTRGLRDTFAILTAHDPMGHNLTPEENRVLQAALEAQLKQERIQFLRVDACSIDRAHCECSLVIQLAQVEALKIAQRGEQMAIFWFDGEAFWLVGAMVQSDPMRLPRST